ncbi:phosphonopyruvate decarboxylase [Clostridium sp. DL-VIII]|uniref:phosphonopyruvate decarboxylase n=1 Tax=Clostridium sp. DL-VIII TaxID=641107 RepID=UPI00023B06AA|nr:phosphonopyruvate decarboxylase [Clostridium sp. DL-VIII]EHJ01550.1 phosphonopyruvate decarboxylase [Clostridium sp. DL-VIII]
MIDVKEFYNELLNNDIDFFAGVPDSLLKSFCAFIKDNVGERKNIIAANEGNAVGLAAGYYLATKKIGLVYMQNSGIGNALNPLVSLADKLVYSIPMLLVIGWRGEPGKKDEPQHIKQGIITTKILDVLGIKYKIINNTINNNEMKLIVKKAHNHMKENNEPYALVIRKETFDEYKLKSNPVYDFDITREDAIEMLVTNMKQNAVVISTTGMASRELFELREKYKQDHNKDFLTVGSMGHASQIALGIALSKKSNEIYCIDGDGALLMHLGGLAIIGNQKPKNFKHILINNGAHDSVGGQETVGLQVDTVAFAKACGYNEGFSCSSKVELIKLLEEIKDIEGPVFLEIKVKRGARKDLGRPTLAPIENKEAFMDFLNI